MDPATLREVERMLGVAIGGLSIFLGYRLFLSLPQAKPGEGRVHLPGGISVYLSRVGPGVFFALFGAILVSLSFHYSVKYSESLGVTRPGEPQAAARKADYSGFGESEVPDQTSRVQAAADVIHFNTTFPKSLRADLSEARRNELEALALRSKLAIMKSAWEKDWGDYDTFHRWVMGGAAGTVPPELKDAAEAFRRTGS